MTPTLPDGWLPFMFRPITAEETERNDDCINNQETIDKIERLSPVALIRCPRFYHKD